VLVRPDGYVACVGDQTPSEADGCAHHAVRTARCGKAPRLPRSFCQEHLYERPFQQVLVVREDDGFSSNAESGSIPHENEPLTRSSITRLSARRLGSAHGFHPLACRATRRLAKGRGGGSFVIDERSCRRCAELASGDSPEVRALRQRLIVILPGLNGCPWRSC
jgi:hypothetical protein